MTQERLEGDSHPLAPTEQEADSEYDSMPPVRYTTDTDDEDYDLEFPVMKILQRTSEEVENEEGKPGEIFVDALGVIEAPAQFAPLGRTQFRIKREDPTDIDSEIVCRSNDSFNGYGDPAGVGEDKKHDCRTCPFSKGTEDGPPECTHIISFIGYLPEHEQLVRFSMQRTALRAARRLNTIMKGKVFGEVLVTLASRVAGSQRQRYHTPVFKKVDMPEEMEIPEFNPVS